MLDISAPDVDFSRMRSAGKDLLSLALIDARNHTLRWIAAFETALGGEAMTVPVLDDIDPPLWILGRIGWFQEYWIARNVQRGRGAAADPALPRLASIWPQADDWYGAPRPSHGDAEHGNGEASPRPDLQSIREWLVATLETTLELLDGADEDDASLYFYRLALFHEDLRLESFATLSQTLGFDSKLLPRLATQGQRPALSFPATRWRLGSTGDGFAFDNEMPAHEVALPEFEIDSQPVTWAQYGEFVEDGGYDDPTHWSTEGRAWLARTGRRTPRHVDQMRHGVLQRRFGQLVRVPPNQPVVHVSGFEADAWCRWAGRRLPGEVEWEAAAHQGASRGFSFGDVREWTASTFRPYPGFVAGPDAAYSAAGFDGAHKVLRGASIATPARLRSAKFRRFERPERDDGFFGFRSCAP